MGDETFDIDSESDFLDLVSLAHEIVLPGASGVRVPEQRTRGAWYDVTTDAVTMTDGMASYGSC